MRAVITVIGKDMVGILAKVSTRCDVPFTAFSEELNALGKEMGLSVHAMHEDIFNSMHRI